MDTEYVRRLKQKANNAAARALRIGKIVKPEECEGCGEKKRLHMHHPDYYKPLEVIFLCSTCHVTHHSAERGSQITFYTQRWLDRKKNRFPPALKDYDPKLADKFPDLIK